MTKKERAEVRAFEADLYNTLHPKPKFTLGEVAQRFDELANKATLIAGFETDKYDKKSFCRHFKCKKWVYDFLSDMAKIKDFKIGADIIEKNRTRAVKKVHIREGYKSSHQLTRDDFSEPTIIVVINKCWRPSLSNSPSLYDCARGYWRVGNSGKGKAYRCKYAIASYYGRVAEVYEIDQLKSWKTWHESPKATWPDDKPNDIMRRAFEGRVANARVRAMYIGKSTAGLIPPMKERVYVGFE